MRSQRIDHKTRDRIVTEPKAAGEHVIGSLGSPLLHGRQAFERRAWAAAFTQLADADRVEPLAPDDLERLAAAAFLSGRDEDSEQLWTRAYRELVACGEIERAVRCAFWQAMMLFERGQSAPGSGWIARARRLLDDHQRDCGRTRLPVAAERHQQRHRRGSCSGASAIFEQAAAIGDRFADDDLRAHRATGTRTRPDATRKDSGRRRAVR